MSFQAFLMSLLRWKLERQQRWRGHQSTERTEAATHGLFSTASRPLWRVRAPLLSTGAEQNIKQAVIQNRCGPLTINTSTQVQISSWMRVLALPRKFSARSILKQRCGVRHGVGMAWSLPWAVRPCVCVCLWSLTFVVPHFLQGKLLVW